MAFATSPNFKSPSKFPTETAKAFAWIWVTLNQGTIPDPLVFGNGAFSTFAILLQQTSTFSLG